MIADSRHILITGGARGIGREIARSFAVEGERLSILDRDLEGHLAFGGESKSTLAEEFRNSNIRLECREVDLVDQNAVDLVLMELQRLQGTVDVLVCNAGGGSGSITENRASLMTNLALEDSLQRNLFTAINVCRACIPAMKAAKGGRIILMSSLNGLAALPTGSYAHYGIAKAALIQYGKYLARDLGLFGITVNILAPGPIETPRLSQRYTADGIAMEADNAALGRWGKPEDVARATQFLGSKGAGHITGQVLSVDGGVLI